MTGDAPADGQTIDVVIPMRNGAATILGTLASVARQSLRPNRIIVVDDGSNDGGADLVEALNDPGIIVVRTAAIGVSHARNVGLRLACSEYVAFLDSDDLWHPEKLRRQLEAIAARPGADVVVCGTAAIDPDGTRHEAYTAVQPDDERVLVDLINTSSCSGWASAVVVRRRAAIAAGGFDETLAFSEDYDFWTRLARNCRFVCIEETLSYSVRRAGSVTRRSYSVAQQIDILFQHMQPREALIGYANPSGVIVRQCIDIVCSLFLRHPVAFWRLRLLHRLKQNAPAVKRAIAPNALSFLLTLSTYGTMRLVRGARSWRADLGSTADRKSVHHARNPAPAF